MVTIKSRFILLIAVLTATLIMLPKISTAQEDISDGMDVGTIPSETLSEAADMQMGPVAGGGVIGAALTGILVVEGILLLLVIASFWMIFTKSGLPGWGALVPIYNMVLYCKAGSKPGWWVLLLLIPGVNFVIWVIASIGVANNFNKGAGFGVGLGLLPIIFLPILAFGKARHQDQAGTEAAQEENVSAKSRPASGVPATGLGLFAALALIAFLCFLGLLFMQYSEWAYYNASPSLSVKAP